MPRGALAGEDVAPGANQFTGAIGHPAENNSAFPLFDAATQAITHRGRLLEDLLEHVMLVAAQLVLLELVFKLLHDW